MSALAPADMRRLKSTLALFASDKDGEVIAAVSAARRILAKAGLGFVDLTVPALTYNPDPQPRENPWRAQPTRAPLLRPHQRQARVLLASAYELNEWERKFLHSISGWSSTLTSKQADRLRDVAAAAEAWRVQQGGSDVDF